MSKVFNLDRLQVALLLHGNDSNIGFVRLRWGTQWNKVGRVLDTVPRAEQVLHTASHYYLREYRILSFRHMKDDSRTIVLTFVC